MTEGAASLSILSLAPACQQGNTLLHYLLPAMIVCQDMNPKVTEPMDHGLKSPNCKAKIKLPFTLDTVSQQQKLP